MAQSESIDYSIDALQPLRDADLLRYRALCAKRLPAALFAHHFLTVQHRWKEIFRRPENEALTTNISPKCINKFYAPHTRNIDNCTFVAVSDELSADNSPRYCIFAFTLEWPPNELMSCLRDSKRIQWQNEPLIEALSNELVPLVKTLLAEKETYACAKWTGSSNCVWLPREEAVAFDVKYVGVAPLDEIPDTYLTSHCQHARGILFRCVRRAACDDHKRFMGLSKQLFVQLHSIDAPAQWWTRSV